MTAGDHKRKARPIAPATIAATPDTITIVVPDVLGKNESHVAGHDGARHTSPATKRYRESVRDGVDALRLDVHQRPQGYGFHDLMFAQAIKGAWRLEVIGVWPRERHAFDFTPCPMGDADAAIPQVLDALQHAGILDDDARVVEVRAWNLYRRDVRATVIRLSRVSLETRDAALAHLAHLVPPAKDPPPKPARASKRRKAATT